MICLPDDHKCEEGTIQIPRGSNRTMLVEAGLLVEKLNLYQLAMSENEIKRRYVVRSWCPWDCVSEDGLAAGNLFPFHYLQRTGAGSRSLCMPAVSQNFQWNGRQVANLCKSGGYMYIIADKELPGLKLPNSPFKVWHACVLLLIIS